MHSSQSNLYSERRHSPDPRYEFECIQNPHSLTHSPTHSSFSPASDSSFGRVRPLLRSTKATTRRSEGTRQLMRRSLAPSQLLKQRDAPTRHGTEEDGRRKAEGEDADSNMVTIQRMPLFGFLEIPKALSKQFKIPSGCILTEKSIALRKIKRLGGPKQFHVVRPGDYANSLIKHTGLSANEDDGDDEAEDLPTSTSNLPPFEPLVLWSHPSEPENKVEVIPQLACKLRPHQREGVQFLFECTMGLRGFEGEGCILADDMGLGKTLMSITLLWTLMNQGFHNSQASAVRKVVVVCPTSLVGNWDNEIRKWVGEHCPTFAVKGDPKRVIKTFLQHRGKGVLIVSYETQRLYSKLFENAAKQNMTNGACRSSIGSGVVRSSVKLQSESIVETENNSILSAGAGANDSTTVSTASMQNTNKTTTTNSNCTNSSGTVQGHSNNGICDLLICDEAHKLKNADSGLAKSLCLLPARKRILLSGTPMQNELTEFFNMVNFCNPGVLGSSAEFKRRYERPILAAREPDATEKQTLEASRLQKELSTIVNEFILKRGNILNAQHLPPKLVQFVCCRLSPLQETLYNQLLNSKEIRHAREGKQLDTLGVIRQLINICSHPKLLVDAYNAKRMSNEPVSDELAELVETVHKYTGKRNSNSSNSNSVNTNTGNSSSSSGVGGATGFTRFSTLNPQKAQQMRNFSLKKGASGGGSGEERFDPELSGKMLVLSRMMQTMRAAKQGERIVVVSNYTQTLDLIQGMCDQAGYPVLRLDGTVTSTRRTKIVDEFNAPNSGAFVFLLSSKAGGCGINLIGGNRLVLFDPDWNPASDKQAAGRIWREGQKRRCFIYRFMSTGSIEEKIIQRQLSKEGLADIVDDKEQVNTISSDELKDLFSLRTDTASDTHDTLRCKRCNYVKVKEASKKGSALAMTPAQTEGCSQFVDSISEFLKNASAIHQNKKLNEFELPFWDELDSLKSSLNSSSYASLPAYSRAQRDTMIRIDTTLKQSKQYKPKLSTGGDAADSGEVENDIKATEEEAEEAAMYAAYARSFPPNFSVFEEFLNRWVDVVPRLTALGKVKSTGDGEGKAAASGSPEDGDDEEVAMEGSFVEQEGCPDDTDFNRWSHHCSVASCDDEVMQRALADDSETVSFVFGLEVNWSLLEAKEAASREENELRKEQQRQELAALNELRRQKKERSSHENNDSDEADIELVDDNTKRKKTLTSDNTEPEKKSRKDAKDRAGKRKVDHAEREVEGEGNNQARLHKAEGQNANSKRSKNTVKEVAVDGRNSAPSSPVPKAVSKSVISRRQLHSPSIDPLRQTDETFRSDWEYLKRCKEKGKISSWNDFPTVLRCLKVFNNNWRIVPGSDSTALPMWTRTPGLKMETLCNYKAGFDYFLSEDELRTFMFTQATLMGGQGLIEYMKSEINHELKLTKNEDEDVGVIAPTESAVPNQKSSVLSNTKPCTKLTKRGNGGSSEATKKTKIEDIDFDTSSGSNDSSAEESNGVSSNEKSLRPRTDADNRKETHARVSSISLKRRIIADSSDEEGARLVKDITNQNNANEKVHEKQEVGVDVLILSQRPPRATAPKTASEQLTSSTCISPTPLLCDLTSPSSSAAKKRVQVSSDRNENNDPNKTTRRTIKNAAVGTSRKQTEQSQATIASQQSGSEIDASQIAAVGEMWACLLCTLENSSLTHPTECRLCGSRRSFNKRPKRAAAASQLM